MPRYLIQAKYTESGLRDILKEGGLKRAQVISNVVNSLGGAVETFFYALGETDVFVIINLPDHINACAFSIATNASGAVMVKTTVLLTPEEMDQATFLAARSHQEHSG
jgi:uncharacterized protein with GYD domain